MSGKAWKWAGVAGVLALLVWAAALWAVFGR